MLLPEHQHFVGCNVDPDCVTLGKEVLSDTYASQLLNSEPSPTASDDDFPAEQWLFPPLGTFHVMDPLKMLSIQPWCPAVQPSRHTSSISCLPTIETLASIVGMKISRRSAVQARNYCSQGLSHRSSLINLFHAFYGLFSSKKIGRGWFVGYLFVPQSFNFHAVVDWRQPPWGVHGSYRGRASSVVETARRSGSQHKWCMAASFE